VWSFNYILIILYKGLMHPTFDEQGTCLSAIPVFLFEVAFKMVLAFAVVVSIKVLGRPKVSFDLAAAIHVLEAADLGNRCDPR
jgi:hypothetical protein